MTPDPDPAAVTGLCRMTDEAAAAWRTKRRRDDPAAAGDGRVAAIVAEIAGDPGPAGADGDR